MVWAMDVQIGKLNEGMKQAAKAEETIGRIEKLADETTAQHGLAPPSSTGSSSARRARLEKDGAAAARGGARRGRRADDAEEGVRGVRRAAARAADLGRRRRIAHGGARREGQEPHRAHAEVRRPHQAVRGALRAVRRAHQEAARARDAAASARRRSTTSPRRRPGRWTRSSRAARTSTCCARRSRTSTSRTPKSRELRDKLGADRRALEAFGERDDGDVDARARARGARWTPSSARCRSSRRRRRRRRTSTSRSPSSTRRSRASARACRSSRSVEARLNGLNSLSADVDRKLEEQLARRAELDTLKTACDGLAAQMIDAQHKLEAVRALENTLVPLVAEVNKLRTEIGTRRGAHRRRQVRRGDDRRAGEAAGRAARGEQDGRRPKSPSGRARCRASSEELGAVGEHQGRAARRAGPRPEPPARRRRARSRRPRISWRAPSTCSSSSSSGARRWRSARRSWRRSNHGSPRSSSSPTELDKSAQLDRRPRAGRQRGRRPRSSRCTRSARAARPTWRTSPSTATRSRRSRPGGRAAVAHRPRPTSASPSSTSRRKLVDEVQTKANAIVHLLDDVRLNLETLGRAEGRRRSRGREGRAARVHAAGGAQHAAHAAARARAGRADRAGHQAAAVAHELPGGEQAKRFVVVTPLDRVPQRCITKARRAGEITKRFVSSRVFVSFYEAAVEIKPVRVLHHSVVRATLAIRRDPFILLFALVVATTVAGAV